MSEISELRARLDELERAESHVQAQLTDPERRENGEVLAEHRVAWETETAKLRRELAAILEERKGIEATIKELQAKLASLSHRGMEVQRGIDVAAERYKSLRDPILRELQAGTADLRAEFLKSVDAHIAAAYRILPVDAIDITAEIRADLASRNRRVGRLKELREDIERTWWKDTDASEGELRSRFARALAAIPAAENKSGGIFRDEFWEFARTGGGRWPAAN